MILALAATATSTVTTADDGWYRSIAAFAQHTAWLQGPMKLYTSASFALLALLALYAWWSARARSDRRAVAATAWLGIGTVIAIGCGLGLKQVFTEARPCLAIHVATVQACPGPADYSFPSDHTIVAVALAAGIWLVDRRLGAVAAILALLEGYSRVYLGQHYPHDVAAAICLSTLIVLGGWALVRRPLVSVVQALESTPLRPLLTAAPKPATAAAAHPAAETIEPERSR